MQRGPTVGYCRGESKHGDRDGGGGGGGRSSRFVSKVCPVGFAEVKESK